VDAWRRSRSPCSGWRVPDPGRHGGEQRLGRGDLGLLRWQGSARQGVHHPGPP